MRHGGDTVAHDRDRQGTGSHANGATQVQRSPGRRTRTEGLVQARAADSGASAPAATDSAAVQAHAAEGVAGSGSALPFADTIQASFGKHDLSGVEAHIGGQAGEAAAAIGADAYATGQDIAFGADSVDLHTAAHEAAHVVQQRGGVQLSGGVGQAGDPYERHADAVADLVVQGQSAEGLLDTMAGGGGGASAVQGRFVQRQEVPGGTTGTGSTGTGSTGTGSTGTGTTGTGTAPGAAALVTDAGSFTDWTLAVTQIQALYIGTNIGIGYKRGRGVESWATQAGHDDPPPVWQELLISAIGIAVSAATAGVGNIIAAGVIAGPGQAMTRALIAAAVDAGKAVGKSAATGALNTAAAVHHTDGKAAYKEASITAVDEAVAAEWRTVNARLGAIASQPEATRWSALQGLYDGARAGARAAQNEQFGQTLEGWMSASAQANFGSTHMINGRTVRSLYGPGMLEVWEMQSVDGQLRIGQPLTSLPAPIQAKLERIFGVPVAQLTVDGTVASGTAIAMSFDTSSVGTLGLHINMGDATSEPSVSYAEIESSTGINDDTRDYFLHSTKKVGEFRVPKIIVGSGAGDFSMGVTENGEMTIDRGLVGSGARDWLLHYAAHRMHMEATEANAEILLTSAKAFLGHHLLEQSLAQLGVTSISS
ncbi:MAG: DUF4157 domain-containing protein [Deltaproteobacteria bacterium]|nr:DUF4157 domain-containing protein [Deltaproteobacteria bacterium]